MGATGKLEKRKRGTQFGGMVDVGNHLFNGKWQKHGNPFEVGNSTTTKTIPHLVGRFQSWLLEFTIGWLIPLLVA